MDATFQEEVAEIFQQYYQKIAMIDLEDVKQFGSVDDYINSFEIAISKHKVSEKFKVEWFVKGLQEDIVPVMEIFKPSTLCRAVELVKLQENSFEIINSRYEDFEVQGNEIVDAIDKVKLMLHDDVTEASLDICQNKEEVSLENDIELVGENHEDPMLPYIHNEEFRKDEAEVNEKKEMLTDGLNATMVAVEEIQSRGGVTLLHHDGYDMDDAVDENNKDLKQGPLPNEELLFASANGEDSARDCERQHHFTSHLQEQGSFMNISNKAIIFGSIKFVVPHKHAEDNSFRFEMDHGKEVCDHRCSSVPCTFSSEIHSEKFLLHQSYACEEYLRMLFPLSRQWVDDFIHLALLLDSEEMKFRQEQLKEAWSGPFVIQFFDMWFRSEQFVDVGSRIKPQNDLCFAKQDMEVPSVVLLKFVFIIWGWYYKDLENVFEGFFMGFKLESTQGLQWKEHLGNWNMGWKIAWMRIDYQDITKNSWLKMNLSITTWMALYINGFNSHIWANWQGKGKLEFSLDGQTGKIFGTTLLVYTGNEYCNIIGIQG